MTPEPVADFAYCSDDVALYLFGGSDGQREFKAKLWRFTFAEDWKLLHDGVSSFGPSATVGSAMCHLNRKLYLFGGLMPNRRCCDSLMEFDLGSNTWHRIDVSDSVWPQPRFFCSLTTYRNKIYLYGGISVGDTLNETSRNARESSLMLQYDLIANFTHLCDLYVFEPGRMKWSKLCNCNLPVYTDFGRSAHSATTVSDGVFVYGGFGASDAFTDISMIYDVRQNLWVECVSDTASPPARAFHASASFDNHRLVIFGGKNNHDWELNDLWLFDFRLVDWRRAGNELKHFLDGVSERYGCALVILESHTGDSRLVIYGGVTDVDPAAGTPQTILNDLLFLSFNDSVFPLFTRQSPQIEDDETFPLTTREQCDCIDL